MTYTFRNNPFVPQIDAAAVAEVVAERIEQQAHDAFLLAHAAVSELQRRLRQADSFASGLAIDRVTGKAINPEELARAHARVEETQAAYLAASTAASQARGQLNNLKKAAENWENLGRHEASQRAAEAAETPAARAIRQQRDAERHYLAAHREN